MHCRIWALMVLTSAIVASSCATAPKPRPIEKSFLFPDVTYDEVWKATTASIGKAGLQIDVSDREFGILTTDWFTFHYSITEPDTNYTDCGTLDLFAHEIERRGRMDLLVREDSSGVALKINAEYEQIYDDGTNPERRVRECVSTGYLEGRIRTLVSERLGVLHK